MTIASGKDGTTVVTAGAQRADVLITDFTSPNAVLSGDFKNMEVDRGQGIPSFVYALGLSWTAMGMQHYFLPYIFAKDQGHVIFNKDGQIDMKDNLYKGVY